MSRPARIAVTGILVFTVGMSVAAYATSSPLPWITTLWMAALAIWALTVVLITAWSARSRKRKLVETDRRDNFAKPS